MTSDSDQDRAQDVPDEPIDRAPPPARRVWIARAAKNAGLSLALLAVLGVGFGLGRIGGEDLQPQTVHESHDVSEAWTCSMHPQIRMDEPGQCPICGMDLVVAQSTADDDAANPEVVTLSARARALAEVRTTAVVRTDPRAEVRLLGRVDYDETRLRMVTPWTDGRIDRLRVRVTGTKVHKGQVVAELYSPEVYAGTRDLLVAKKQAERLSGAGLHGSSNVSAAALSSAREKLRLIGLSDGEIEAIERSGNAPKKVSIRSPFAGTVLERKVEQGDYVKAGTVLYHIADLSKLWVQIDAYESDLSLLARGNAVVLEVDALPGETFEGNIAFIDPVLDERTRTARVRVEVDNAAGTLRPGMFAQAVVQTELDTTKGQLVVPRSAVLFTGRRSIVYVAVPGEPGAYALRVVRVGGRGGPMVPVLTGLSEGERVVTNGAFVVDADLQLRGGSSMMTRPDDRAVAHADHSLDADALTALKPVLDAYISAQTKLAEDDFDGARDALTALAQAANDVDLAAPRETREAWDSLASSLAGHGRRGATATGQADVRRAFESVSASIADLLTELGNPDAQPLRVAFCPMAFDNDGAQWVQRGETLANPYYGPAMLRCGDIRATVGPAERLPTAVSSATATDPLAGPQH